jgi:DNA-binding CsgD family transcriptional regulator
VTAELTASPGMSFLAPGADPFPRLYGRERELSVLADVARRAGGTGGALVIRGEAGVGKSALAAAAAARARQQGIRVLSALGTQTEARLPFAGLHQLLRPVLHLADRLPARQQASLLAAFGMADESASELFVTGLATLELVSDLADSTPVLLIADDAHWLDDPSCTVLAFVARRLSAEPAAMLITVRDGFASPFDDAELPELRVDGLSDGVAGALLDAQVPGLERGLRERLITEAAGNPLALIELPIALRSEQLHGQAPVPSRLPLTARLERAFAAQEADLPAATRSLLLTAAADDGGILGEVLAAASVLDGTEVTVDAVAPAVSARLIEIYETSLRFRHPLVRSAIYQAASQSRRRAAHSALAEALTGQHYRRAWHRAAAALGPDEQVAAELDGVATRAQRHGAAATALDALHRAAQLSESPASRGRRLLRATEIALESGRPDIVAQILTEAESLDLPLEERYWLSYLREVTSERNWSGAAGLDTFVRLAERMRDAHLTDVAARSLLTIALRCWWSNPSQDTRSAFVAAAQCLALPDDAPAVIAILAWADPVQCGTLVNDRISRMPAYAGDAAGMFDVGSAATAVWAWDRALVFLDPAVEGLRAQGQLGMLARALTSQAWAGVHLGRGQLALAAGAEGSRLARETGQLRYVIAADLAQATAAAERGEFDAAEPLLRQAEAALLSTGANPMLALVQFARGRGAVLHQRYEEGLEHLRRTLDPADPAYQCFVGTWGLADMIEAATQTGDQDAARDYLDQLERLAAETSGPLLQAQAAYARPLVSDGAAAEALYQTALERDLAGWPGYRGRMLLWYGRWLRRQRRIAESRAPLRAARDCLDALAFSYLAQDARRELRASGESSGRRTPEAWDQLTPQELQIAQLAADGLSNREIGQQLYISHRTVGAHLHRIFPKLGITSRSQLHAAISA